MTSSPGRQVTSGRDARDSSKQAQGCTEREPVLRQKGAASWCGVTPADQSRSMGAESLRRSRPTWAAMHLTHSVRKYRWWLTLAVMHSAHDWVSPRRRPVAEWPETRMRQRLFFLSSRPSSWGMARICDRSIALSGVGGRVVNGGRPFSPPKTLRGRPTLCPSKRASPGLSLRSPGSCREVVSCCW